ncbi:MAG: hypothetical protein PHU84_02670 [Candidatus Portnoybacteria bacterium]|nr:hypothetical protein [Candidatus Portnoybacteria bacterium]
MTQNFLNNRFLMPIGKDDEGYFRILEKYKKFIGGVYLGWQNAPSGRVLLSPSEDFFDRVYKWCLKNNKRFNILFNATPHDLQGGFDYDAVDLTPYSSKHTVLIFASMVLFAHKNFGNFQKGVSVTYRVGTPQHLHSIKSRFPEIKYLVIDRDINRDYKLVNRIIDYADSIGVDADVMLNEGCAPRCSLSGDHGTFITLAHFSDQSQPLAKIKSLCNSFFANDPANVLRSPFVTREMLPYYKAKFFKLVGRDTPVDMLEKMIRYYVFGEPMDVSAVFTSKKSPLGITTDKLPAAFHKKILSCKSECYRCDYCAAVYKKLAQDRDKNLTGTEK